MLILKSLLLRLIGIITGPVVANAYGFCFWIFGHGIIRECLPWCPGWWLHPLAIVVGGTVTILILTEIFERQNLVEVIENQNSAYFSSGN